MTSWHYLVYACIMSASKLRRSTVNLNKIISWILLQVFYRKWQHCTLLYYYGTMAEMYQQQRDGCCNKQTHTSHWRPCHTRHFRTGARINWLPTRLLATERAQKYHSANHRRAWFCAANQLADTASVWAKESRLQIVEFAAVSAKASLGHSRISCV